MAMPISDPALRAFADALADRYDDLEPLGGGGMADLLVGRERRLDRRVVIKRVAGSLDTSDARSRFEREIALLATLQHPNIVPLLSADMVDNTPYFVMPLVVGESLRERLTRGPLSVREAVAVLEDVAQALECAHGAGVVHRDIKPGNILLTRSSAVVADFGIARALSKQGPHAPIPMRTPSDLTLAGHSLGTPRYMSPEQFAADPSADHRVDLYALGVVAYEMLAGVPPFTGATPSALARAHMAELPTPLRTRRADVPPALATLILKCLEKDPDKRPPTATAVLRALRSPSLLAQPSGQSDQDNERTTSSGRLGTVLAEFLQAWRSLRRAPVLLLACVLCLAIGLGSTSAIFSIADRIMLRPVDVEEPERLVSVFRALPASSTLPWSAPNFLDIAAEPAAEGIAAFGSTSRLVALGDRFAPGFVIRTTGKFFTLLRTRALHGRVLMPSDDDPNAPAVVVASYEYWRSHLGGSPTVVGTMLRLDGEPHQVVGVLPPNFRITNGGAVYSGESLWVPMRFTASEREQRTSNWLRVFARLAPGTSPEGLQTALVRRFAPVLATYPELAGHGIAVTPLIADAGDGLRRPLALLIVATLAVLAIAVINVSSLLLARGIRRQPELAVRTALGATRWEVMRVVFAEGALIALLGWIIGLGIAAAAIKGIATLGSARIAQLSYVSIDLRTVLVALVTALIAAVAGTAAPAWRAARAAPGDVLRGGRSAGSRHQHRTLATLVVIEGALAVTLLISAGLVMKGFVRLTQTDPGFQAAGLLTMRVRVAPTDFKPDRAAVDFLTPALQVVNAVPGVVSAGAISQLMYAEWGWNMWIRYEGRPEVPPIEQPLIETRNVTPGFFAATGQRLLAGRLLDEREMVAGDSVQRVVVNQALALRDFPNGDPVGKRIYNGDRWIEIVGVVSDVRNFGPITEPRPEAYWTYVQRFPGATGYNLVIRTQSDDPMVVAAAVERALRGVYPGVAISRVQPMAELMSASIGWPRFVFALFATLAGVALVLALAGLFGILSYTVEQQRREYALRSALGAPPSSVRALIFGRAGRIIGVSLGAGLVVAWMATRTMAAFLYGVEPLDVPVWTIAVLAMAVAGLSAAVGPALRASRVAPMTVMRAD